MKKFITTAACFVLTLFPIHAADFTPEVAAVLDAVVRKDTAELRERLVTVGRTSLPDLLPGVLLDEAGHVLCPYLPPIDGAAVPYLIYPEVGARFAAETVWEDSEVGLAIVRCTSGVPEGKVPVSLALDDSLAECSWLLVPSYPPSVPPGDPVQLHLGHLLSAPSDGDPNFSIEVRARRGGHAVFDLAGRLVAVTGQRLPGDSGFTALPISALGARFPEFANRMPPKMNAGLPTLPYFLPEKAAEPGEEEDSATQDSELPDDPAGDALAALATRATSAVPAVAIFNHAGVNTTGVHGLIIEPDGIVLTKASEIGATPVVQFGEESYPAVLLATDEATDLALLSIKATGLPVVQWSDAEPGVGTLLHSPQIHTAPPFNLTTTSGILSHRLAAHPAEALSIYSPEQITSLGFVPEHDQHQVVIAAILRDGSAVEAGLKLGDVLLSINDTLIPNRQRLREWLSARKVGEQVSLKVDRGGEEPSISLRLGRAHQRLPVTEPMIGSMGADMIITPPSIRRSGFPQTLVHDLVIEHWQNGSPICDSNGRVLGINIATVTYDRTLALPVPAIKEAIARMRAKPVSF